jgi:hypothetical protein
MYALRNSCVTHSDRSNRGVGPLPKRSQAETRAFLIHFHKWGATRALSECQTQRATIGPRDHAILSTVDWIARHKTGDDVAVKAGRWTRIVGK